MLLLLQFFFLVFLSWARALERTKNSLNVTLRACNLIPPILFSIFSSTLSSGNYFSRSDTVDVVSLAGTKRWTSVRAFIMWRWSMCARTSPPHNSQVLITKEILTSFMLLLTQSHPSLSLNTFYYARCVAGERKKVVEAFFLLAE